MRFEKGWRWGKHLLEPVVQQVLLVLLQDQLRQLSALKGVQLAASQQGAKVDQQRRRLPGRGRHRLEALDRLLCPQHALETRDRKL